MTISTFPPWKLVFTSIPPTFLKSSRPFSPTSAYRSLGHLILTFEPTFLPNNLSSRQASTTAKANRYCTNTNLVVGNAGIGDDDERDTRRSRENCRQPDKESQIFVPRPRPASW